MSKYSPFKARLVMGSAFELKTTNHKGEPETEENKHHWFMAFAVPKGAAWDAIYNVMYSEAAHDPKCGQSLCDQPGFNWKIEDCDNPEDPTKLGTDSRPAGHMLIKFTRYKAMGPVKIYDGNYKEIINKTAIKKGDYFYVAGSTKFNGAATVKTNAAMYQNIEALMFAEAGEEIVSEGGFNPIEGFAGIAGGQVVNGGVSQAGAPVSYTPAPVAPATPAPTAPPTPTAPPPPATDLLVAPPAPPVEEKYNVNGVVYTKAQLLAMPGWSEAHLTNLPRA